MVSYFPLSQSHPPAKYLIQDSGAGGGDNGKLLSEWYPHSRSWALGGEVGKTEVLSACNFWCEPPPHKPRQEWWGWQSSQHSVPKVDLPVDQKGPPPLNHSHLELSLSNRELDRIRNTVILLLWGRKPSCAGRDGEGCPVFLAAEFWNGFSTLLN